MDISQFLWGAEKLERPPAPASPSCVSEAGQKERGGHASPTPGDARQGQGSPCETPCPAASHSMTNGRKHPWIHEFSTDCFFSAVRCSTEKECCTYGYAVPAFRPSPPELLRSHPRFPYYVQMP